MGVRTITILGQELNPIHIGYFDRIEDMESNKNSIIHSDYESGLFVETRVWQLSSHFSVTLNLYIKDTDKQVSFSLRERVPEDVFQAFRKIQGERVPLIFGRDRFLESRKQRTFDLMTTFRFDDVYKRLSEDLTQVWLKAIEDWKAAMADIPAYRLQTPDGKELVLVAGDSTPWPLCSEGAQIVASIVD